VQARLDELDAAMQAYNNRSPKYDPEDMVRAGAFVSVDHSGHLHIERGFIRLEDQIRSQSRNTGLGPEEGEGAAGVSDGDRDYSGDSAAELETDGPNILSDKLMTELTAYRTLALRNALAANPEAAFLAATHALALRVFYHYSDESCLQIAVQGSHHFALSSLGDSTAAKAIDERHEGWQKRLPQDPRTLWQALFELDREPLSDLFAHCVSMSVNAVHEPNGRSGRLRHANQLASHLTLDMAEAGWVTTAGNYLGRVTKDLILDAVREAKGEATAELLIDLKKKDMAAEAERLLQGTGWLPEPLRTPLSGEDESANAASGDDALPAFLGETALQAAE